MEFITGVLFGYAMSVPGLIVLALLGILFEHNNARGWAVFVAIVSTVIAAFYFKPAIVDVLKYGAVYAAVGLFWSFWRYKRFVDAKVAYALANDYSESRKAEIRREIAPTSNVDTIVAWILIWPFSMIENVTGDVINVVQRVVTTTFRSVYNRIYDSAIADLK